MNGLLVKHASRQFHWASIGNGRGHLGAGVHGQLFDEGS